MIYLDYSANTPVDARVLEQFCAVERRCIGNANSHHQAGSAAKAEIDAATIKIASLLGVQPAEIIYTSGASEANNFALKGLARLSRHAGRHIISTPLEHSSVSGTLTALQEQVYEIDLLDVKQDGTVDLEHLKDLLRPDTICVAITLVDSELGVVQPVQEIAAILKAYPHCHLHVDATQAVGKIPVSFEGVDTGGIWRWSPSSMAARVPPSTAAAPQLWRWPPRWPVRLISPSSICSTTLTMWQS